MAKSKFSLIADIGIKWMIPGGTPGMALNATEVRVLFDRAVSAAENEAFKDLVKSLWRAGVAVEDTVPRNPGFEDSIKENK